MKLLKGYPIIVFTLLFCTCALAQTTQSTMYDAIGILNAKHGVNAIITPIPNSYTIANPVSGKFIKRNSEGAIPDSLINSQNTLPTIYAILARNANLPVGSTPKAIYDAYKDNPFLKSLFTDTIGSITINQADFETPSLDFNPNAPLDAGLNSTTIADNLANGAADFLIQRAGEEISVSVFEKLQQFIGNYPEFAILFPETTKLIKPVTPYEYANTVKALRDALQNDLSALTGRLPLLYGLPKYRQYNKEIPAVTLAFTATALLHELNGQNDLGRTLHDLDTSAFLTEQNNYASFIHLINISSNSLRKKLLSQDESMNYPYFTLADLNAITNQDPQQQAELAVYYLGLFYQQCSKITFWNSSGPVMVSDLMKKWANNKADTTILRLLISSSTQIESLDEQLQAIKKTDQQSGQLTGQNVFSAQRFELYNQLITSSLKLLSPFVKYPGNTPFWTQDFQTILTYWPTISNDGIATVKAFSLKDYTLGISNLANLMSNISQFIDSIQKDATAKGVLQTAYVAKLDTLTNQISSQINTLNGQISSLNLNSTISQVALAAKAQKSALQNQINQLSLQKNQLDWQSKNAATALFDFSKVMEYVNLLAALSQTNNSQEVESLLETYALPSGSYQIKKETALAIAVNAYVGGFFAPSPSAGSGFTNKYGLTAPIGFTVSHGFKSWGGASLLLGVFDIGGIIQYKLDNNGAYQQNVNLAGLVSPSVQLVYSIPINFPLAIGGGWQWTSPPTAVSNSINLSSHFNLFLAIDIPLFNLFLIKK